MKKQELKSVPVWYQDYIDAIPDVELQEALRVSDERFIALINGLSESEASFSYEEGKWTIKDLILHISDAERVFSYRALRIARGDTTRLSGYDHNRYVQTANAAKRSKQQLLDEYQSVRAATRALFGTFEVEWLSNTGRVDDNVFSPGVLGFIIAGHQWHHTTIIEERYISNF